MTMATNKGGDLANYVEQFRQIYEPQKHWEARKTFLMNNWSDYPERQLVSLSRVWANMEFDGCVYEPELMERVRELGAGVEVCDIPLDRDPKATNTRGLGYSNQHHQQQLKRPHQQVFGGNGLLGAAPPGASPSMSPMSTMQGTMLASNQASSSSTQPTKRYKPGDRNYDRNNPDMSLINELSHRLDWLMRRPQALLDQHWNFLNAAAHKSGYKNMQREFIEVRVPTIDEEGNPSSMRQGWIMNVYVGDTKLITFNGPQGMVQKDVTRACGEKLIKMLLNPKSLTIKREKKTSDNGKEFDKELIQLQLPSLIDDRDIKEIYGKGNVKEQSGYDPDDPFANFVLLATNDNVTPEYRAMQTLMNSSQSNKGSKLEITVSDTKVPVNGEDVYLCKVILNDQLIGFGTHEDSKKVRHVAANVAVDYLKKKCPQVKHNRDYQADQDAAIPMSNIVRDGDMESAGLSGSSASKAISEGNIGHKMLKMMGWSGQGGLGKGGFGISQPIIPIEHIRGEGLGYSEGGLNMDAVTKIVEDYIKSGNQEPLVFPATLNREERKQIHCIAHKFNLKSKSYGKDVERYLLVSTKRSLQQVVMDHVEKGDAEGGYHVHLPGAGMPRQ